MPKLALTIVLAFVAGFGTSTAEAHSLKMKYGYGEKINHRIHHVIRNTWSCQDDLGRTRTKTRNKFVLRSVAYRRYVLYRWRWRFSRCNEHLRIIRRANVNWWLATDYANKIFPGTRSWLISCSASEGGHTSWVSNRQGSGAGGWLQFMSGTFYAYVGSAFRTARSRGHIVMRKWMSWYSPAGQAITGGYMRWTGKDGSHWVGSGC